MANLVTSAEVAAQWTGFTDLANLAQAALIEAASTAVESYCRRTFALGTVTEALDGTGKARLWLSRRPVSSVGTVTVNGGTVDNTSGDAWTLNGSRGELVRGAGYVDPRHAMSWPRGYGNVSVTYVGGYATIPGPVKQATVAMVKHMAEAATKTGLLSSESIGDYSYVLNTAFNKGDIPPAVGMMLAAYVQDDLI
jgi:hypothetical protein